MSDRKRIAVIGGGISGVSVARMLHDNHDVTLIEAAPCLGGLIKCTEEDGVLYHRVGGHVFNSKNQEVLDWFWSFFDRQEEFVSASRNSAIYLNDRLVGYPIENHLYQLDPELARRIVEELLQMLDNPGAKKAAPNFKEFLLQTFGPTLFKTYFEPYNHKLWGTSLDEIPLDWLEGKLPVPEIHEVLISNILRQGESGMVHATFFYPKQGGSQFIIDRLADGLKVTTSSAVDSIGKTDEGLIILGETYDQVIYTGDVRRLSRILDGFDKAVAEAASACRDLRSRATSNVLCRTEANDLSWLYLPEGETQAHRIIYTGNFSDNNNADDGQRTCVVEFSGEVALDDMHDQIRGLPGRLTPIAHNFEPNSYIVHDASTARRVANLSHLLSRDGMHLLGRFAEWEYYNMDKCMESGMRVRDRINSRAE